MRGPVCIPLYHFSHQEDAEVKHLPLQSTGQRDGAMAEVRQGARPSPKPECRTSTCTYRATETLCSATIPPFYHLLDHVATHLDQAT